MRTSAPHLTAIVALATALASTACWGTNERMPMADEPERLAEDVLRYPDDAVDNGEIGFRELLALSGTSELRSGVIAGLQSQGDGGDGLLLFVNHYWPGQETFTPGRTTNVNLTVGDRMHLPDGSFVLDSVADDGEIAGTFTALDDGEPVSIQLSAGEPFAVPGLDTTGFTPLEINDDSIHFEVSTADP